MVFPLRGVLIIDQLISMKPSQEVEMVFRYWEKRLKEVGICESIGEIDFLEIHAFGAQPKDVNPVVELIRFHEE